MTGAWASSVVSARKKAPAWANTYVLFKCLGGRRSYQQPPAVHLYFDYLTTYTLSLLPLSLISILVYFLTPGDSYPPFYAFILSLYSTIFVAVWRIKERKLAVRWGTRGSESVAVSRLRPEYVAKLGLDKQHASGEGAVDTIQAGNDLKRDVKVAASVPIIIVCGVGLGVVLMGIFLLEAFVAQVYDGVGRQVVVSARHIVWTEARWMKLTSSPSSRLECSYWSCRKSWPHTRCSRKRL